MFLWTLLTESVISKLYTHRQFVIFRADRSQMGKLGQCYFECMYVCLSVFMSPVFNMLVTRTADIICVVRFVYVQSVKFTTYTLVLF